MKEGKITLSQEQLKTLFVINRFIDKSISRQQAAELLGLSTRQITRLKKGVLSSGAESLIHKNTGRKPAHAVSDETKEAVLKIYSRPELSGVNFLHFKDILLADFGISLSYSAISSILKNAGTLKLFFRTFFGGAFLAEAMQQITAALEQKAMLF